MVKFKFKLSKEQNNNNTYSANINNFSMNCLLCYGFALDTELVTDQMKLSESNNESHEHGVFHKLTKDALETHQALSSFNDMNNQKRHRSSSSVSTGSTSSSSSSSSSTLSPRKKMKRRKRRMPCPQVSY